jgi:hypothetical protein
MAKRAAFSVKKQSLLEIMILSSLKGKYFPANLFFIFEKKK